MSRQNAAIPGLAWADIRHEWILSLCLFLAVAAVIGPLLLLFGLKNGTVETLRGRLLQDPKNREIRPMVSRSFTPRWLDDLSADFGVEFLVPSTRSISASITLTSGKEKLILEALPSAPGDPLLLENGAVPPQGKACVLSAEAARKLSSQTGQSLTLRVKRLKGSRFETGSTAITISGITDPRATSRTVAYFPLDLLEAVEKFKDGQAVPELGWNGRLPLAEPVFDGVVLGLDRPMDPVLKARLISGTGLSRIAPLRPKDCLEKLGYRLDARTHLFLLTTKKAQGASMIAAVRHRLREKKPLVLPWVAPIQIRLGKKRLNLAALPDAEETGSPWAGAETGNRPSRQIILPRGTEVTGQTELVLDKDHGLKFPVQVLDRPFSKGTWALAPPGLAGILNLNQRRALDWLPEKDLFILKRRGYAAFRLYARTLDQVPRLKQMLESQGIPVHTEAERIRDLKELDRHLGYIFWLIALGGILGGAGALTASLYASVERKRRDLGVLGLIGFSRRALLSFPLYQALFLSVGGLVLALGFYLAMAGLINHLFAAQLAEGEHVCRLGFHHLGFAAAGVVVLGQIAAAVAAFRVIAIDPAEALRDE